MFSMNLYVVRHGQTEANTGGILQGPIVNGQLTELGEKQMELLRRELTPRIQKIYSSPLKRVAQSAEILNQDLGVEIILRENLKERDYGSLAGNSFANLKNGAELKKLDDNLQYDYRPFGGESVAEVKQRIQEFITEIETENLSDILVVTSRGPIRLFYQILNDKMVTDIPNGSLHTFSPC